MLFRDSVEHVVGDAVVDHHRAEQRGLGLDVLRQRGAFGGGRRMSESDGGHAHRSSPIGPALKAKMSRARRSEEHTSELQSLMRISYAVFCLNKNTTNHHITIIT